MHHALVFSTSKHLSSDSDAASWLADFANAFAAITKRAVAGEIDLKARYLNVLARLLANPFACLIYWLLQRHQPKAQLNLFIRYEPMGQIIWRCYKPPAWVWPLRASHCCWPKWQSTLIKLISAACYTFKAIKSMISSQIKFRGSIYPIQIKGAEPGPFVFDFKI